MIKKRVIYYLIYLKKIQLNKLLRGEIMKIRMSEEQIKKTLLDILLEFADFCDRNNLKYYLSGGTMLGAIRHNGFIPWDDDVDVLMPRPDYEKLMVKWKENPLKNRYRLATRKNGLSSFPFVKIYDLSTEVVGKYTSADKNLWIDIFPMDGVPEDEKQCKRHLEKARRIKGWMNYSMTCSLETSSFWKKIVKIPAVFIARLVGTDNWAKQLEQLGKMYNFEESRYAAGVLWSCGARERMEKEKYLPIVEVEFEGKKFHAPQCWDEYLKAMYGDYMKLPPKNSRKYHLIEVYKISEGE